MSALIAKSGRGRPAGVLNEEPAPRVREMIERRRKGQILVKIAADLGVSKSAVCDALRRWRLRGWS